MPNIGFTIRHLAFSFPWVGLPKGHLYLNPRASACLSVGPTQSTVRGHPLATWVTLAPVRLAYPVCPENEICAAPIGICRHIRAVLLDLFYHCRGCLVTGMPSLIGLSWEKEYPSLTERACDGLSWDTPAGI